MHAGAIDFDVQTQPSMLTAHLADCLRRVYARNITVDGNRITFRGGVFRLVTNWNVLVPFGSGQLEVDTTARQVRYRLSVAQLVIVATGLVAFIGSSMLVVPLPEEAGTFATPFVAMFCLIAWGWFVVGNLVIGVARFRGFLRRSVASAPSSADDASGGSGARRP